MPRKNLCSRSKALFGSVGVPVGRGGSFVEAVPGERDKHGDIEFVICRRIGAGCGAPGVDARRGRRTTVVERGLRIHGESPGVAGDRAWAINGLGLPFHSRRVGA